MPTSEEIEEQIKNLDDASKILGFKEIKVLPDILWEDEVLERVVQGRYHYGMGLRMGHGMGILCATNKRLIYVEKGLLRGLQVEDFLYDKITSIEYKIGMIQGKINVFALGNKAYFDCIEKKQAKEFGDYVRARITKESKHAGLSSEKQSPDATTVEQKLNALERLAKLKEQGILTEEELQAEKKAIIG